MLLSSDSSSPEADASAATGPASRSGGSSSALAPRAGTSRDRSETADGGLVSRTLGKPVLSGADLEALATQALTEANPITRRLAFSRLLESLTVENALTIREQLVALGAEGSQWRDFNYAWGAIAGEEAFTFAHGSEERDLAATFTGWAAAKPDEAIALLENLPEELQGQRNDLTRSLISGLADYDKDFASSYVVQLANNGVERADRLIDIVANEALRSGGPESAARWSETLPDGPVKASAMDQVAERYVQRDPAAAAEWVGQFASQDYATRAIAEIGEEWAERDPESAVAWLEDLPEGNGQLAGFEEAFGDWEDRDPVAAGEYLMNMTPSPQRDAAISGFVDGYARNDPETAIAWAQDISDPVLRERSLTEAGQTYFRRNPSAARAWLETSGLPAEVQERITDPPRRRR